MHELSADRRTHLGRAVWARSSASKIADGWRQKEKPRE